MHGRIDGLRRVSESTQFDTHKMQKDSPDGPGQRDSRHESYRGLRRDLRPALAAVLRAAEVPRAFGVYAGDKSGFSIHC